MSITFTAPQQLLLACESFYIYDSASLRIRKKVGDQIRRKVRGSIQGRISKLQYRYLASVNPYKYDLFNVTCEVHLDTVISSYYLSGNVVMELYIEFAKATTVMANIGTEAEVESTTTRLCGGFTGLLQT
ncbi:hypothetical protein J1N35_034252 [Gossypium stocksii]|uniref:Uncharacterized protein n=1 Tax=Gossypium stocksii TaxID=47602 RepID=A0A9D3URN5_9ROSI|nr:hypothetical protein J1N35_034252 [Gossypium stocksii]